MEHENNRVYKTVQANLAQLVMKEIDLEHSVHLVTTDIVLVGCLARQQRAMVPRTSVGFAVVRLLQRLL